MWYKKNLQAMLAQTLPKGMTYDVWLADEDPSTETRKWCRDHNIFISSRKGRPDYHQKNWPRRTRCKEGNLAFFYDTVGYKRYDFVSQLDADHVPGPTYLHHMLAPFSDPGVGYVSAPSICDANAEQSWSARCRLYAEGSLHGALQAGYNRGWAPLCIGSHYAIRTKALKQIGGLGPELAEDHSTTLMMNAGGWKGVHALDAIAHGDGSLTFNDLVTQEFQWSRSLVSLLLNYSSRWVPKLPAHLRFQFLFCQIWYPLYSSFLAVMFALPIWAIIRQEPFVAVTYPAFLLHFVPATLVLIALAYFWRRNGWLRPYGCKVISWESLLFLLIRWPWALAGSISAIFDKIKGDFVDFKITPKGKQDQGSIHWHALLPYILLTTLSLTAVILVPHAGEASGFYFFALINGLSYAIVIAVILIGHTIETTPNPIRTLMQRPAQALVTLALLTAPFVALSERGVAAIHALSYGADPLYLTRTTYTVAGAAMGSAGLKQVKLTLEWKPETTSASKTPLIQGLKQKGDGPTTTGENK